MFHCLDCSNHQFSLTVSFVHYLWESEQYYFKQQIKQLVSEKQGTQESATIAMQLMKNQLEG